MVVSAANPDGTIVQASQPTTTVQAAVPVNQTPPLVVGTAQRSSTLTATVGTWAGMGNTYGYQWQRSSDGNTWTSVTGANVSTYTVGVADEGEQLRVLITATNADGTAAIASAATQAIPSSPPVNTVAPTISGAAQRGATLTSTQGTWTGIGNTYSQQWQRSSDGTTWTNITGATGAAYTLAIADEGDEVRLNVTATNPDGTVSVATQPTNTVQSAAPVNTAAPTSDRHRPARVRADRERGNVERARQQLRLPMAAVFGRHDVDQHHGRDRCLVHASESPTNKRPSGCSSPPPMRTGRRARPAPRPRRSPPPCRSTRPRRRSRAPFSAGRR